MGTQILNSSVINVLLIRKIKSDNTALSKKRELQYDFREKNLYYWVNWYPFCGRENIMLATSCWPNSEAMSCFDVGLLTCCAAWSWNGNTLPVINSSVQYFVRDLSFPDGTHHWVPDTALLTLESKGYRTERMSCLPVWSNLFQKFIILSVELWNFMSIWVFQLNSMGFMSNL